MLRNRTQSNTVLRTSRRDVPTFEYAVRGRDASPRRPQSTALWESLRSRVEENTYLAEEEKLAGKTTLQVGGRALYYAEPASLEDLRLILEAANKADESIFILGRGSNLIVPDEGFKGLVIRLNNRYWKSIELRGDDHVWISAGAPLKQISLFAKQRGWAGFEFLEGIPGSLGGALRMNAGAMGSWIFDCVESVQVLSLDGEIKNIPREAFSIAYRECGELRTAIALGAVLKITNKTEPSVVEATLEAFTKARRSSQPRQLSAGCIFKNPPTISAGALIDSLGLKGRRNGAASVSSIHGNFIINEGGASSEEVIALIREVRREVKTRRGVELEPEVLLLGKSWEDVL